MELKQESEEAAPTEAAAASEADLAFIAEHGRLRRKLLDSAFDPFRRPHAPPSAPFPVRYLLPLILVPLRILLFVAVMPLCWLLVLVLGPKVNERILHNYAVEHLPAWRRRACAFATRVMARTMLISLGFWRVRGTDDPKYEPDAARGATIVSNHVSLADPMLLAYVFAPAFVAKMAVARIPFVGRVGAAQHAFYIDRLNGGARNTTDAIVERQRLAADPDGCIPPIAIFPEGTTTNGKHLLKFRSGAFVAGTPVAPVLLRYPYKWFSPSYEAIKTKPYVWGLLSQPENCVHYYRLPVYFPNAQEREDPKLYAENVRKVMQERSDFLDGEEKLMLSDSNFIDKAEYLSLIRGEKLRKGMQLTPVKQ